MGIWRRSWASPDEFRDSRGISGDTILIRRDASGTRSRVSAQSALSFGSARGVVRAALGGWTVRAQHDLFTIGERHICKQLMRALDGDRAGYDTGCPHV